MFISNLIAHAPGATIEGFYSATLHFILLAPIVIVFIVATRQVIGLRGIGIAAPLIATYLVDQSGVMLGLIVIASLTAAGFLTRLILKYAHLLFLPRMGLLVLGSVGGALPLIVNNGYAAAPLMAPLVIATAAVLTEKLFEGNRPPLFAAAEFLLILLGGVAITHAKALDYIFIPYPWLSFVLGAILLVCLGRWTGLRLTEYLRFKLLVHR